LSLALSTNGNVNRPITLQWLPSTDLLFSFQIPTSHPSAPSSRLHIYSRTSIPFAPNMNGSSAEAGPSTPRQPTASSVIHANGHSANGVNVNGNDNGASSANVVAGNSTQKPDEAENVNLETLFAARREEEMTRRDRSLAEFLVLLDGYKPLVSNFRYSNLGILGSFCSQSKHTLT
jgi:hypothetical protein